MYLVRKNYKMIRILSLLIFISCGNSSSNNCNGFKIELNAFYSENNILIERVLLIPIEHQSSYEKEVLGEYFQLKEAYKQCKGE